VGKIAKKKNSLKEYVLLIRHPKYNIVILSKILSYKWLFRRFCPLGASINVSIAVLIVQTKLKLTVSVLQLPIFSA